MTFLCGGHCKCQSHCLGSNALFGPLPFLYAMKSGNFVGILSCNFCRACSGTPSCTPSRMSCRTVPSIQCCSIIFLHGNRIRVINSDIPRIVRKYPALCTRCSRLVTPLPASSSFGFMNKIVRWSSHFIKLDVGPHGLCRLGCTVVVFFVHFNNRIMIINPFRKSQHVQWK